MNTTAEGIKSLNEAFKAAGIDFFDNLVLSTVLPTPYSLVRVEMSNPHSLVVQVLKYGRVILTSWLQFDSLMKSPNPANTFRRFIEQGIRQEQDKIYYQKKSADGTLDKV